jgi:hypothetical protein
VLVGLAARAAISVSSIVGADVAGHRHARPARSTSRAVIAVVVVLPLVPVMASTLGA